MASNEQGSVVSGILALTPAESKRLIAKAVLRLPEVQRARETGRIIVANGTTTAPIAAELLGKDVPPFNYSAGVICDGMLAETRKEDRLLPCVFDKGQPVQIGLRDAVADLKAGDVFIKSGNAVDPAGNVGVLMADKMGGTIGTSIGVLVARGIKTICPVGLEKMVPSVLAAAEKCGTQRFKYALGSPVGLMPVTFAQTVTEIQALAILTGACATHVASGGIGGSEGSVVLVVEGSDEVVSRTIGLVREIKAEAKNVAKEAPITWREVAQ
ncbi:MAG: hypothetical protein ACYC1C_18570 [Chloroflexota bacterium]